MGAQHPDPALEAGGRRGKGLREEWQAFLLAVQFLTVLPVPAAWTPERMAASLRWHPAVGLLVGSVSGATLLAAALVFPPLLAALLAVGAGLVLTGALHEDGLADVWDGLGGSREPARALEIMRDSRIGTYGALALGIVVGGTILALSLLPPPIGALSLVAGHAASRGSSLVVVATAAYVRAEGAGAAFAGRLPAAAAVVAAATVAAPLALLAFMAGPAALAGGLAGLALGHLLMRRLFERRLGGYTGDCLGAVQQTSAFGFYLGVAAWA